VNFSAPTASGLAWRGAASERGARLAADEFQAIWHEREREKERREDLII